MANDQLFRKRQFPANPYQRRRATRTPKELVLIVCEGEKCEPNYLRGLKDELGLQNASVTVCGEECGSAPMDVVEHAWRCMRSQGYDHVFCVFDRDTHTTFSAAIAFVKSRKVAQGKTFAAIASNPCFEYWVICHFAMTTRPFGGTGKRSPCEDAAAFLRTFMPNYKKNSRSLARELHSRIDTAMRNAQSARAQVLASGAAAPLTTFDMLVSFLMKMAAT